MSGISLINRLRNVSIAKKLYFTVGIMATLIAIELMILMFAINTLSSVRTLVGAEGLWSKAQKGATISLQKYSASRDEKDYAEYLDYLTVNLGDRKARLELLKGKPITGVVRQGFLEGRLNPDDIDGVIHLLRRFYGISYISNAIGYWSKGDTMISVMQAISDDLHTEINSKTPSQEKINEILKRMNAVNVSLTIIEDNFSATLGAGSRWVTNIILNLLLCLVLTVEISGLSITIFVSKGITKGLREIIRSAKRIELGDFTSPSEVYSNDEIGILANSFNEMTDKLEQNIFALKQSEAELKTAESVRSKILVDMAERNNDLEQFSYVVSHNLRSPVANILGIAEVLNMGGTTSEEQKMMMGEIFIAVEKLDAVIKGLNYTLQLNREFKEKKETVQFSEIVEDIKVSISHVLKEEGVVIITDFQQVNEMSAIKSYLYSIFFNLIANSIKYRKPDVPPAIEISSKKTDMGIELTFKDNGIGIDLEEIGDEIFNLFKRFLFYTKGKGMGLYMVKKQVETLGGSISITSNVGVGTAFKIVFT
jgi:signal transduction histidine kinase